ncbi:MAG: DUF1549 and DUF1553 domain-containing protein [Gemmataceae bacterium]|nr:DUF1549 and DUF1553 domain-containing protein [Gemmataceae bacterium]
MLRRFSRLIVALAAIALPSSIVAQEKSAPLLTGDRTIPQAIDHYVELAQRESKTPIAAIADDSELLRRWMLDLVGRIPVDAELNEYLASSDADKKTKLVDRLLASPGFVRHQTQEMAVLLQASKKGKKSLYEYVQAATAENRPWDRVFREIITPDEKDAKQEGASEFLKSRVKELDRLTIDVSNTFFGVNVSCAQCHDHPLVPTWTQDHFYGLKAFFVRSVDAGGFLGEKDFGVVKYIPNKGKEKIAPPMFLTGKKIDDPGLKEATGEQKKKETERLETAKKSKKPPEPAAFSLRAKLAETALAPDQRMFFSRAIVNRLVHRLTGRGLVMPLDQMHLENPASHPELLQWLGRDLEEHGYDLRRLVRGIVLSNTYARASRWEGDNAPQEKWYAMANVRPLTPHQMAASLKIAAMDQTSLPADPKERDKRIEDVVRGSEGLAVHFPQPAENFQVSVTEAMLFANNETLTKQLLEGPSTLVFRMKAENDLEKRAELAVRTVMSRKARPDEVQAIVGYLQRRTDRVEAACQQVVWSLMTSAEFRFNH